MNSWEKLTEEDIRNIRFYGAGCWQFLLSILFSVLATLAVLDYSSLLDIW